MSIDIDRIKRKLLIKYPTFGSVIANLEFQESIDIATSETDGKVLLYNPKFLGDLSEKQQIFIFAHEVCHVAFEHIFRSEGKDKRLWKTATDSVINALLKQDGLPMVEGVVNIPEAINYDADEMYNKLLEKEKNKQGQQNSQDNQEQQNLQGNQQEQNSQSQQEETTGIGHDTHSLWDKAIEDRKKEQQKEAEKKEQEQRQTKKREKAEGKEQEKKETEEKSKFVEQGEKETFKQNKIERRKQLQELSRELANKSSHEAGDGIQREGKSLSDIGIATPLIDWRKLLKQAIRYDEEYTRKNARMRNGYFRHRIEQIPMPEAEILLDTSGSVSEVLLKNFLRECKNILDNSKVKVGCFNTEFHGFTELKNPEDIDNMRFPIGGGTDFNAAVGAFSRKAPNKIIFTDGKANMPKETVRNVIWVVFGDKKINPKGGKVINITGEQLRKLYKPFIQDKDNRNR